MRTVSIYFAYFAQFLKTRMAYKGDFIAAMFTSALASAGGLIFILFLLDGEIITNIKGWSRAEIIFIYGYSFITTAIFSMLAYNLYDFANRYIIEGQFDRVLLRPLNSLSQVLFESFNLDTIGNIILGIVVIKITATDLGFTFTLIDYLWLAISCISGAAILLAVFVILSSLSFHFEDRMGITPPFYNLINFSRYPLPIFNRFIQILLSWIVPFGFIAFYPATHFFNRTGYEAFCYGTPLMALACIFVSSLFWRWGISKYSSTGN